MATSRSLGSSSLTTRPSILISPDVMSSRPAIMRNRVLLPQPEGPTKTTNSRSATSRSTPCTTATSPNDLQTPWRLTPATHAPQQPRLAGTIARTLLTVAGANRRPGDHRGSRAILGSHDHPHMSSHGEPIRVGLVGYGAWGRMHVGAIARIPELSLAAVLCGSDASAGAAAADLPGIAVYRDLDALLRDGAVDLVDIVAPNHLHATMALAALEAGKHVLLEKPMATTLAD